MEYEQREFESDVISKEDISTNKPRTYNVIIYNDDYTTMDFVISILETIFHHPKALATKLMQKVHNTGKAVAGTYVFEIAETKCSEAIAMARENGHPLKCTVEPA